MPQFAVVRPCAIFDFGNQRWLNPDEVPPVTLVGNRRHFQFQPIEHCPELKRISLFEARPDRSDIDHVIALARDKQETANPAPGRH